MVKSTNSSETSVFTFRKTDTIGNPSAESDDVYLATCFVDTGMLDILRSCSDQRGIVLGRTGSGKTALLESLANIEERSITLDPHSIALSYLSNSTVLRFFEDLGVRLDPFYRFLWRHIFVVEILRRHLNIEREDQQLTFFDNVRFRVQGKQIYIEAFAYLQKWGTSFIATTEEKIKDITRKIESTLEGNADAEIKGLMKLGARGSSRLSEEQRYEFTRRGQEVIDNLQLHHLNTLFDALDAEFLTDQAKRYYLLIDRLDENWVDEPNRNRLIRALIELMRDVNSKVRYAKMVIGLREDLFERVLRNTSDAGFQGEKYRALTLPISWEPEELVRVLDRRVGALVSFRYTKADVSLRDVLPKVMDKSKQRGIDYMLDRTLLRPRDAIAFFNACMVVADGDPAISATKILIAEPTYSDQRLKSLADEWSVQFPVLYTLCNLLRERPSNFYLRDWKRGDLDLLTLTVVLDEIVPEGDDTKHLLAYFKGQLNEPLLRIQLAQILFRTGIIGLKTGSATPVRWSHTGQPEITRALISDGTGVHVHKMLWTVLGIRA